MRAREVVLDPWSALNHKAPMSRPGGGYPGAPSWLPEQDKRRLTAYTILKAYERNSARLFLPVDEAQIAADGGLDLGRSERREFGEPGLIVKQTTAALLGETQEVSVPGAGVDVDVPDEPEPPADDADEQARADYAEQLAEREQALAEAAEAERLQEREDWLRAWADSVRLPSKLLEGETNSVGQGDSVYLLAWNPDRERVDLTVVDPGFYFPVLPEGQLGDDYPSKVHLAWEIPEVVGVRPRRVHRVTYELAPIEPETENAVDGVSGRLRRLFRIGPDEAPVLRRGDQVDADTGRITRRYPWQAEGAKPSRLTCYMTEAEWDLDETAVGGLDELAPDRARYMTNSAGDLLDRLDLGFDFLPVVHVPNTPASSEHFGESSLSLVLQLLDELASADTDESASSATTGSPPIGVSGAGVAGTRMTIGPGEVWSLGPDGELSTVDTSSALAALGERIERLLGRLSVNARLPGSVLGRGGGQDSPSGFHLLLTFGPLKSMVREMRLSRDEKLPLLLKFVQRLAMLGGVLPAGPTVPAELILGSYLPTDLDSLIERVRGLYDAGLVSLPTAVGMLRDAGVPVENVADEVAAIESRDYARANELADATGDQAAVRELLGLEPVEQVTPVPLPITADPLVPPVPPAPLAPPAAQ